MNGPPELIQAPPGPYKIKPPNPGGLDIAGESQTAFETSAGEDKDPQLDLSKLPETPVASRQGRSRSAAAGRSEASGRAGAAARRRKPAGAPGSVIQLGAFANQAQAERAWTALSVRFPTVAALNKLIVPFPGGIRLRACGRLAGRGEAGVPGAQGRGRELLRGAIGLMQAAIYGLEGLELTDDERGFFRDADPAGFILFRRNCETPEQLLRLTDSLRELTGRADLPILIDQEGGRVARMRPPEWPAFPAAERFAQLYGIAPSSAIEAVAVQCPRDRADASRRAGSTSNALPLLDVRQEGASDIIGDRALGSEPMQVAALGRAVLDGMASAGVVGIVKHMPGHGRALVDSHKELPVVTAGAEELETDLEPFERLAVGADGDDRARRLRCVGRRAAGEPVADRHPRHHPRPHRLRRLADERRYRHGSAGGRFRQPRRRRGRGRLRCRAPLLGQDGGDGRGRRRGSGDERRGRSPA